ncbi:DUF6463 family protein [Rhizobacter sp. Root1221]|uniref:DUF6463 family protein n=1 Tax=Rhizobacter sp. Root1221 TaxID=1736433 RepID=UPI0006F304A0|nr:DUF6463 family protein [Rhizobacter sp. Root1221]KQV91732.1 hypothetical protein ASC87_06565 [Rhizobacter sp. Root1221]
MPVPPMTTEAAWALLALGLGHVAYTFAKFRGPLKAAAGDGFTNQFKWPEERRTALWFALFGPLLILAGHTAVHAAAAGDMALIRIVGGYVFTTSVIGVAAVPKSPFLLSLPVSGLLLARSLGL